MVIFPHFLCTHNANGYHLKHEDEATYRQYDGEYQCRAFQTTEGRIVQECPEKRCCLLSAHQHEDDAAQHHGHRSRSQESSHCQRACRQGANVCQLTNI